MKNNNYRGLKVEENFDIDKHIDKIKNQMGEEYKDVLPCLHTDGIFKGVWIVLDFKDVVIHIFTRDTRAKYNIEKLWKDNKNFIEIK